MADTPFSASDLLAIDNQLCFAVYSTAHAFNRAYKALLDPLGLTYPQYLVMLALWERDAPMRVGEIGTRLMLDTNTLTPLLKRLESAEMIERRRSTEDERQVLVSLTPAGAALRTRAQAVPPALFGAMGCSLEDARELQRLLGMVRSQLRSAADAD